jgi:hypothetical protein
MAPRTVQQAFGLKDPELNALAVLAGLEGYRGDGGRDVAAVASNVLSRRLAGNWGGLDIRNIAKSPGQYEAVFPYSMEQLADPAFGASVLGGQQEFEKVRNIVNNLQSVGEQFKKSRGAQSFRGVAAYGAKKPTDYVPVPGKSNFYFDPLSKSVYEKGEKLFTTQGVTPTASTGAQQSQLPKSNSQYDSREDSSDLAKMILFGNLMRQPQQSPTTSLMKSFFQPLRPLAGNFMPMLMPQLFQ